MSSAGTSSTHSRSQARQPFVLQDWMEISGEVDEAQPALDAADVGSTLELLFIVSATVEGAGTLTIYPQTALEPFESCFTDIGYFATWEHLDFTSSSDACQLLHLTEYGALLRWRAELDDAATTARFEIKLLPKKPDRT